MEEIFSGKTIEDAISNGLKALKLTLEEIDFTVIDEGKKGIFGIGAKPAQVKIVKKEKVEEQEVEKTEEIQEVIEKEEPKKEKNLVVGEDSTRAVEFLTKLFTYLNIEVEISAEEQENLITITLSSEKTSSLIGYRGEILDSLQTLAGAIANKGRENYRRVIVNCENYREKREDTLKALAVKLADKAVAKGRKIKLEPMNPFERRIIHSTLADREDITTESEGKDPARYIVIIPKNFKPRNNNKGGYKKNGNGKGYNKDRKSSAPKAKKSLDFSSITFLGNSLKDDNQ